jgi:hypothetical protein
MMMKNKWIRERVRQHLDEKARKFSIEMLKVMATNPNKYQWAQDESDRGK